jgi:tetratricopeptide (TPR) repeat protein
MRPRRWGIGALIASLLALAVGLQIAREEMPPLPLPQDGGAIMYVRSPEMVRRVALGFDGVAADTYWIRTLQHYGGTKLSSNPHKAYEQLYPLLDLTTSLDPHFDIAYKFGAIFLSERYPNGPNRPDLAIALLMKGLAAQPEEWQFAQQIGFVYYWWLNEYQEAAAWFLRAAAIPGAPDWLKPLAAVTLAQGGNRASSRQLWQQVAAAADDAWLQRQAQQRLQQLDALDQIDQLVQLARVYVQRHGAIPRTWHDMMAAGLLRGVPEDPAGFPLVLDIARARITISPQSTLNPLPVEPITLDGTPVSR